jgi:alpha-beta hydrolase superfamily lysophospholipase
MQATPLSLETADGVTILAHRCRPEEPAPAGVQIAHGWAEHDRCYLRVAEVLGWKGHAVAASDHDRHGRAAGTPAAFSAFAERDSCSAPVAR